ITYLKQLNVPVTAVFTQFCETSTGVIHPVHQLGHALKAFDNSLYFIVDGVSCIGAVDVDLTKDKIYVLVSGSQKAIMLPPGLAFVAYSDRAKKRFADVKTPRFY
ncbi:aminotransferase class V-fold PLP-dependent enzyme, partial [Staphylococcus aureus]